MLVKVDRFVRVATGLRSYRSAGAVHDSTMRDQLANVNERASIDERMVDDPFERCNGDVSLVKVLRTEMDDEEELALKVEAGSDGT
jgi:hypothetical protein